MRRATQEPDSPISTSGLDDFGAEVEALLDAARDLASTLELPKLLEVLLDHMKRLVDYSGTSIWELQGPELTFLGFGGPNAFNQDVARTVRFQTPSMEPHWSQLASGEPIRMRDIWDDSDVAQLFRGVVGGSAMRPSLDVITSLMWVPLVIRHRVIGLLSLTSPRFDAFSPRDATLALAVARQAAVAIENARLHARARHVAVLEERQRLARELHESATDSLMAISQKTETAEDALDAGHRELVDAALEEIAATTQQALSNMRLLLFELRPPLLEQQGVAAALRSRLQAVESRSGLKADLERVGEGRLSTETEHELFRLAQEALNNVLKHAHARAVRVRSDLASEYATLEVSDDGVGFEPSSATRDGGLERMRDIAARLGGMLSVESSIESGTRVRAKVPR